MSAYAALKDNSSIGSIFHESGDVYDDDGEDEIHYQANSSEEEFEEGRNSIRASTQPMLYSQRPQLANSPAIITWSKYIITKENTVFGDNYIIFGLKAGEYLVVNGQCNITIQKGAVLVNQSHYITANTYKSFNIVSLQSQSLPIISSTELGNSKSFDNKTEENEHLFTKEFKSIIKVQNLSTGLEAIGKYHPPFKGLLFGKENDDIIITDDEGMFQKYSFEIVLCEKGFSALSISEQWSNKIAEVNQSANNLGSIPTITMVIGNKNSGKSTFSKILLNSFLLRNENTPVCYLDLDPGQSELSPPYSMSLCVVSDINFGTWFPSSQDCHDHYFGYTSPVHLPNRYLEIVESLLICYENIYKSKGYHLIINTPGWIKGYGKEILTNITDRINPDTLILLSGSLDLENEDNSEILQNLRFKSLAVLPGIYQVSKYSPSQMRVINKLLYFHQTGPGKFDFQSHILDKSPYKISYETKGANRLEFKGINAVSVLNHSVEKDFNYEDVFTLIEATLMGVYFITEKIYETIGKSLHHEEQRSNFPYYLEPSEFLKLLKCSPDNSSNISFLGLIMIHSTNSTQRYMNVYLPPNMVKSFQQKLESGYRMILVRGEGDLPSAEIFHPGLVSHALKRNQQERSSIRQVFFPYVSFERKPKLGGVWKARRNVLRRGHQR